MLFPAVAFAFFLVTNEHAPAFAVGDFIEPQATKLIIAKPGMAYRNNATESTWFEKMALQMEAHERTEFSNAKNCCI